MSQVAAIENNSPRHRTLSIPNIIYSIAAAYFSERQHKPSCNPNVPTGMRLPSPWYLKGQCHLPSFHLTSYSTPHVSPSAEKYPVLSDSSPKQLPHISSRSGGKSPPAQPSPTVNINVKSRLCMIIRNTGTDPSFDECRL